MKGFQYYNQLSKAYSQLTQSGSTSLNLQEDSKTYYLQFAYIAEHYINQSLVNLKDRLKKISPETSESTFDLTNVIEQTKNIAIKITASIVYRPLLLELHIKLLKGKLKGQTAKIRNANFIKIIRTAAFRRKFIKDYPALVDVIKKNLDSLFENTFLLFKRFQDDFSYLKKSFLVEEADKIITWRIGAGDSHSGGNTVAIVDLSSGRRIVYKPRSLSVDVGFNKFIDWINSHQILNPIKTVKVVNRDQYGWCECVKHIKLSSEAEVISYFQNQGKMLAVFYVLHATDLHYQNLIVSGPDPYYVDVETLFHISPGSVVEKVGDHRQNSRRFTVLDTNIAPDGRSRAEGVDTGDASALGAEPLRIPKYSVERFVGDDGDNVEIVRGIFSDRARSHLPIYNGVVISSSTRLKEILAGFCAIYRLILMETEFLLSDRGIAQYFRGSVVRQVFRPTKLYVEIINKSLHPDYLIDAVRRESLIDSLYTSSRGEDWVNRLIDYERVDLYSLDVPYFFRQFENEEIFNSSGKVLEEFSAPSPKEIVFRHLKRLDLDDLKLQKQLIEFALMSDDDFSVAQASQRLKLSGFPKLSKHVTSSFQTLQNAQSCAIALASRILDIGVGDGYGGLSWVSYAYEASRNKVLALCDVNSLYDGKLGIALFLGMIGAIEAREEFCSAAVRCIRSVMHQSSNTHNNLASVGVFDGAAGLPYVLYVLGYKLERADFISEARRWIMEFQPDRYNDGLDIIKGAAGCIIFFGRVLDTVRGDSVYELKLKELIEYFASRLVQSAQSQLIGIGWPTLRNEKPLTGFSHGNAGFAAALYMAGCVLRKDVYTNAGVEAIAHENSYLSDRFLGWQNLRTTQGSEYLTVPHRAIDKDSLSSQAWCHGAPGILVGRKICLESKVVNIRNRDILQRDVDIAWRITSSQRAMGNASLCHGELGIMDILTEHGPRMDVSLDAVTDERQPVQFDDGDYIQWRCGDLNGATLFSKFASAGLMVGLSGIGYGLLRLGNARHVPSLLSLKVV